MSDINEMEKKIIKNEFEHEKIEIAIENLGKGFDNLSTKLHEMIVEVRKISERDIEMVRREFEQKLKYEIEILKNSNELLKKEVGNIIEISKINNSNFEKVISEIKIGNENKQKEFDSLKKTVVKIVGIGSGLMIAITIIGFLINFSKNFIK